MLFFFLIPSLDPEARRKIFHVPAQGPLSIDCLATPRLGTGCGTTAAKQKIIQIKLEMKHDFPQIARVEK